ncbi:tubulin epsilon and delta complex protein 2 isoform X2 [Embiotoca jacksoni]|uniref:tubulin epsilon and delta complex protein 2 isoform X2 n=1 Tax=Embiotoca jacksoni TaxID=100190 RepID=UPI0037046FA3
MCFCLTSLDQTPYVFGHEIGDDIDYLLQHLHITQRTPQPQEGAEETDLADDAAADADTSPGVKEDIELLERALKRALRVRTGSEPSEKDKNKPSGPHKESATPMDVTHSSAASKGSQATFKSNSKSASLGRNAHKKTGLRLAGSHNPGHSKTTNNRNIIPKDPSSSAGVLLRQASRRQQQAVSESVSSDYISALLSKNKTVRSSVLSGDELGKATSFSTPSSNNIVPFSHTRESGACSLLQQSGTPSDHAKKWKSLRSKQSRLWDKVIALERKPAPGRSHFMERMRATFPKDWPCGCPDQTRAVVDRLTRQGRDLTQLFQAEEVLTKQTPESATELGGKEIKHDSRLTLERLQLDAAELQISADQVKQDWKAWDRWRPEGGCLCPTGANGAWGDGITAPLPQMITYTTEAELQELEKLRMRLALLQQEAELEQALSDALSPQLSSIAPGPGCPNPSVLRHLYSLLGEGGQRFPAIILDSEPE